MVGCDRPAYQLTENTFSFYTSGAQTLAVVGIRINIYRNTLSVPLTLVACGWLEFQNESG